MYTGHHFVAAILGTISTVGWGLQGVGLGYLYRQVSPLSLLTSFIEHYFIFLRKIWYHHNDAGHSVAKVTKLASYVTLSVIFINFQAKSELAEHGAKAYFTRG